jgi:hypothetical protein
MASLTLADMARRMVPVKKPEAKKWTKPKPKPQAAPAERGKEEPKKPRGERWYGKD